MKSFFVTILLTFICLHAKSQTDSSLKKNSGLVKLTEPVDSINSGEKIYDTVEIEAAFPGGESAWIKYLQKSLNTFNPAEYGARKGTYKVVIEFIVDKEGKISAVKPLTKFGHQMEEECMRIIKQGPKWIPAIQDGRQVKAYRSQPITFMVEGR